MDYLRVIVDHQFACARYIGDVDGQKGHWVGIEWDAPERGKHDGSLAGKRYFQCQTSTTSGSFIRLPKVNFGQSLAEAIEKRYISGDDGMPPGTVSQQLGKVTRRELSVEFVGQEEVRKRWQDVGKLQTSRLNDKQVSFVGHVAPMVPRLQEISLHDNLISTWHFVADLAQQLPALAVVDVSGNRICPPHLSTSLAGPKLPGLTTLVLTRTHVPWEGALVASLQLPNLRELYLGSNSITCLHVGLTQHGLSSDLNPPAETDGEQDRSDVGLQAGGKDTSPDATKATLELTEMVLHSGTDGAAASKKLPASIQLLPSPLLTTLRCLSLEDCGLGQWEEVLRLSGLPHLEWLSLNSNRITHVWIPSSSHVAVGTTWQYASHADPRSSAAALHAPPWFSGSDMYMKVWQGNGGEVQRSLVVGSKPQAGVGQTGSGTHVAGESIFRALRTLLLGGNDLEGWRSVDELDRLPSLREVRLSGNPRLERHPHSRSDTIARVGKLTSLNASEVTRQERRDSELRYLRDVLGQLSDQGLAPDTEAGRLILQQHPRVHVLEALYGEMSGLGSGVRPKGVTLRTVVVRLTVTYEVESEWKGPARSVEVQLPLSCTMGHVRILLLRLFRVAPEQQLLSWRPAGKAVAKKLAVDDVQQVLGHYIPRDEAPGCEIIVKGVSSSAAANQRDAARLVALEAKEAKVARQLEEVEQLRKAQHVQHKEGVQELLT